jgi:nucleoside-diphosphate-sugar epimerase
MDTVVPNSTILRFATLWGDAPNFRVDLGINHFALEAATTNRITPTSDAKRPILHVQDAADAIVKAIDGGIQNYHGIYNVTGQNTSMFKAADTIGALLNAEVIKDESLANADHRSYYMGTLRDPHLCPTNPRVINDSDTIQRLAACASKNRNKPSRIEELKRELAGND